MAGAAITAPKSGGQLFLAGKHDLVETVIVDVDTLDYAPTGTLPVGIQGLVGPAVGVVALWLVREREPRTLTVTALSACAGTWL
jgi:hypothetical protein